MQEQIRIAAGEKTALSRQRDIVLKGHAIECRNSMRKIRTSFHSLTGRILSWHATRWPGIRVDSHAYAGYYVPPNYDFDGG